MKIVDIAIHRHGGAGAPRHRRIGRHSSLGPASCCACRRGGFTTALAATSFQVGFCLVPFAGKLDGALTNDLASAPRDFRWRRSRPRPGAMRR